MVSRADHDQRTRAPAAERPTRSSGEFRSLPTIGEQAQSHADSISPDDEEDAFMYVLCPSQPLPTVDLSHAFAQRMMAHRLSKTMLGVLCRNFRVLAMVFRVGMASLIVLLFLPQGAGRNLLSAAMPLFTLSVVTTMLLLSTDILWLLLRNYEFWFLTVINTLNWVALAVVVNDARALGCFAAWFAYQSVIMIDANHRTYATTLSSTIASTPLLASVAALVAVQWVKDGHYVDVHLNGRKIGDVSDLIMFTTSTLMLFFVKLFVLKKKHKPRLLQGLTTISCTTLKTTLRLVPRNAVASLLDAGQRGPVPPKATPPQLLFCSTLRFSSVDSRRTVLSHRLWQNPPRWVTGHATKLRAAFYAIGTIAYTTLTFDTLRKFYVMWVRSKTAASTSASTSMATRVDSSLGHQDVVFLVISALGTMGFCGGFFLFYQRDLLRAVLWNFDFVFSASQPVIFHVCLCDAQYWSRDIVVIAVLWDIWFFWALSLDALTPNIKFRIFRFQRRFAAPVLASVIVGTATTSVFLLFVPNIGLRDREIWSYSSSSGVSFSLRSQAILIGRSVTVVLWCSRQAYLVFAHRDDELSLIRGGLEYLTPYSLISSTLNRGFASTRKVLAVPLMPSPTIHDHLSARQAVAETPLE